MTSAYCWLNIQVVVVDMDWHIFILSMGQNRLWMRVIWSYSSISTTSIRLLIPLTLTRESVSMIEHISCHLRTWIFWSNTIWTFLICFEPKQPNVSNRHPPTSHTHNYYESYSITKTIIPTISPSLSLLSSTHPPLTTRDNPLSSISTYRWLLHLWTPTEDTSW